MKTLLRLLRAGFHSVLLFVLPWGVGAATGLFFDVGEVEETGSKFAQVYALFVVPALALTLVGILVKVGRELRQLRTAGTTGLPALAIAADRHVRVLTGRGVGLALASMVMVGIALSAKWAQFGVLAVVGLGLVYLLSTIATTVSAFFVRGFDERVQRARGSIEREMSPTVVDAGDPVEERFFLSKVPVPPAFRLLVDERLPARLGGDTRFAVDRSVSRREATVSAPLPRTPRGVYHVGPASIWYEDVLGLTRVHVASHARATLRALPRLRPVLMHRRPSALARGEGSLSFLARLPTEDLFRTREYVAGDDLRRVHWRQSVNTGKLVVRVAESLPYTPTRVLLVLDTFLPPGLRAGEDALAEVLDLLVEGWVGLAHALARRGEKVRLATAVRGDDGHVTVRALDGRRGEERRWRAAGSEAAWQHEVGVDQVIAAGHEAGARAVVVTAGLGGAPRGLGRDGGLIVADTAGLVDVTDKKPAFGMRLFFYDYPVGSDDNRLDLARVLAPKPKPPEALPDVVARAVGHATDLVRSAGQEVLVLRRKGAALELAAP